VASIHAAVLLISFAILGYEIALMRYFSIVTWHHLAYMIISLALLGFGASGTYLALLGRNNAGRMKSYLSAGCLGFSILGVLAPLASALIPSEPLFIVWDLHQVARLFIEYLLFAAPFFLGALAVGSAFILVKENIHTLYFANLVGSGLGAIGVGLLLNHLPVTSVLGLVCIPGAIAGVISTRAKGFRFACALIFLVLIGGSLLGGSLELPSSQFKALSMAKNLPEAEIAVTRSSVLGKLDVVEAQAIRLAPGLSLNYRKPVPTQVAVFTDGDSPSAINRFDSDYGEVEYLRHLTSALPYFLGWEPGAGEVAAAQKDDRPGKSRPNPQGELPSMGRHVLVLGSGGGSDVLQALSLGARRVTAVEVNPDVIDLVREEYGDFSGRLYDHNDVEVVIEEARGFLEGTRARYDLICISLLDSYASSSAGVYSMSETYLYTTEAFAACLNLLEPGGILSVTRWLRVPPADNLKMFATAVEALEGTGGVPAAESVVMIRGWATCTIAVKPSGFAHPEVARVREFCREHAFDLCYVPGITADDANRFNILEDPWYFDAATKILSHQRESFYESYPFNVRPARDERPYFHHFFDLRSIPYLIRQAGREWIPFVEWGYLVVWATLLQALIASVVFIVLPVVFLGRRKSRMAGRAKGGPSAKQPRAESMDVSSEPETRRSPVLLYFFAIGLAFMFVEMSLIQRFVLVLSNPVYSVSTIIFAVLASASLGSVVSSRMSGRNPARILRFSIGGLVVLILVHVFGYHPVSHWILGQDFFTRLAVSVAAIIPLGFFMGMPFPMGLTRTGKMSGWMLPWAWGVNGCASVMGAAGATLLSVAYGFSTTLLVAAALYLFAAISFRGFACTSRTSPN
jgi:SAM-dependent methyltransferase